jgi:hypothetical protein
MMLFQHTRIYRWKPYISTHSTIPPSNFSPHKTNIPRRRKYKFRRVNAARLLSLGVSRFTVPQDWCVLRPWHASGFIKVRPSTPPNYIFGRYGHKEVIYALPRPRPSKSNRILILPLTKYTRRVVGDINGTITENPVCPTLLAFYAM